MLGITPYGSYSKMPTRELAKAIIRSMRGPSDYPIEHKYTRNLALLVSSHIYPHVYPCMQKYFTVYLQLVLCRESLWGRVLRPLRGGNFTNSSETGYPQLIHQKVGTSSGRMSQWGNHDIYYIIHIQVINPNPKLSSLTHTYKHTTQCNWCWEYWRSQL